MGNDPAPPSAIRPVASTHWKSSGSRPQPTTTTFHQPDWI